MTSSQLQRAGAFFGFQPEYDSIEHVQIN